MSVGFVRVVYVWPLCANMTSCAKPEVQSATVRGKCAENLEYGF